MAGTLRRACERGVTPGARGGEQRSGAFLTARSSDRTVRPWPRRLTQRGKDRRDQLMAFATTRFADQGYHPTSVSEIVAGLGVGKGVFYWYFDSKEQLFLEILRDAQTDLRRRQQQAIGDEDDPIGRIELGLRASLDVGRGSSGPQQADPVRGHRGHLRRRPAARTGHRRGRRGQARQGGHRPGPHPRRRRPRRRSPTPWSAWPGTSPARSSTSGARRQEQWPTPTVAFCLHGVLGGS